MALPFVAALIPALAPIIGDAVKRLFPDPDAARAAEGEIAMALMDKRAELEAAAAGIIQAEARSDHWLAATWRPVVMLTFTALIVARWLGYSAPGISEAEVVKLWSIVELGLGGYVIGRSAEKIVPSIAAAIKAR
jgi:hypothetical protein